MTKITTDFGGSENAATRLSRLGNIYDFWWGAGAFVLAGTLGTVRTTMNTISPNDGTNDEAFGSWLTKWNALNDPSKLLFDTLSGDTGLFVVDDAFGADGVTPVALQGAISLAVDDFEGLELGAERAGAAGILVMAGAYPGAPAGKFLCRRNASATEFYHIRFPIGTFPNNAQVLVDITTEADALEAGDNTVWTFSTNYNFGGPGRYRRCLIAGADGSAFIACDPGNSTLVTVNSVREVLNYPAFQNAAAARPLAGRAVSDVRNLLANSGFEGAVAGTPGTAPTGWTNGQVTGEIAAVDALGLLSGNRVTVTTSANRRTFTRTTAITLLASTVYHFTMRAEVLSGSVQVQEMIGAASLPSGAAVTYLIDGVAAAATDVPAAGVRTITAVITVSTTAGTAQLQWGLGRVANTTGSVRFDAPRLILAADAAKAYQRTTSGLAPDITEAGVTSHPVVALDGTDDAMTARVYSGQTYGIFIPGRYGSAWYGGFTAAADGTITVGPTSIFFNGVAHADIPTGILRACGTVPWSSRLLMAGYSPFVLTKSVMTTEELRLLVRRYAAIGAKGLLVEGNTELLGSGSPSGAGWVDIPGGPATTTSGNLITFGGQFSGRRNGRIVTVGSMYRFRFDARQLTGNTSLHMFIEGTDGGPNTPITVGSSASSYERVIVANTTTLNVGIQDRNAAGHGQIEALNFSLKQFTPEPL